MAFALLLLALWAPRLSEGGRPDVSGTGGDSAFILNGTRSARSSTRGIKLVSGCEELPCATFEEGLTVAIPGVVSIKAQTRLPNWNPKLLFEDGDGNKIACVDMKANRNGILLSEKSPCSEPPLQTARIPPNFYSEDEWLHLNISLKVDETLISMPGPHSSRNLLKIPALCQRVQVTECERFGYSPQSPSNQQGTDFPINTKVSKALRPSEGRRPDVLGTGEDSTSFLDSTRPALSSTREIELLSGCEDLPCKTFKEGSGVAIPGVVSIKAHTHLLKWNPKLLFEDGDGKKIACIDMEGNHIGILLSVKHPCNGPLRDSFFLPPNFYVVYEWLHFNISVRVGKTFIDMYEPHKSRNLLKIPALCQRVQVTECGRFGYSPQLPYVHPTTSSAAVNLKETEGFPPTTDDPTPFQKADLAHLLLLRITTGLVFIATTFSITIFSLYLHVRSFVLVL